MELVRGLEHKFYVEQMCDLGVFNLEKEALGMTLSLYKTT